MVKIFTQNGFREEAYGCGFQMKASRAFVEKHGKKQIEDICREIMIRFREEPETVPAFSCRRQHNLSVKAPVWDRLKFLSKQRGLSVNGFVRESLHCKFLKRAEPVEVRASKSVSCLLSLSPYEEKLLDQWKEMNGSTFTAYLSTLASLTQPLPHADLVALSPVQALTLYPAPELYEAFSHSARVYGYLAAPLIRQILAFLDRPFDPQRLQDRYLDWLTGGYITQTLIPSSHERGSHA